MPETSTAEASRDDVHDFRPSRSCAYEGWTVVELKKRAKP